MKKGRRILIADDDPGILDAITLLLQQEGYDVKAISDDNHIRHHLHPLPHLLLLDIWLSGTNGKEICKSLKADKETSRMPILIFSANRDTARLSAEAGADDFLLKPFQINDLLEKIEVLTAGETE